MDLSKKSFFSGLCALCLGVHALASQCQPHNAHSQQAILLPIFPLNIACAAKSSNPELPENSTNTTTTTSSMRSLASITGTAGFSTSITTTL